MDPGRHKRTCCQESSDSEKLLSSDKAVLERGSRYIRHPGIHQPSITWASQIKLSLSFECLFNATLKAEVISWRGKPDNAVLSPKYSSSAGRALNHCATGPIWVEPNKFNVRINGQLFQTVLRLTIHNWLWFLRLVLSKIGLERQKHWPQTKLQFHRPLSHVRVF